jgi:hypothetical protein
MIDARVIVESLFLRLAARQQNAEGRLEYSTFSRKIGYEFPISISRPQPRKVSINVDCV